MGRVKLEIKKIESKANRAITYTKRRNGLLKKAHELSVLCNVDIGVIIFSESGVPFVYCSKDKTIEELVIRYGDISLGERTRLASDDTKGNIEHGLQAPIVRSNDLQLENQQLKASLHMMNQQMESWKQKEMRWNGRGRIADINNYDTLMTLKGELDEAGRQVHHRLQELDETVGLFEMNMMSRLVFETSNQDLANMPSTSQKRELFQEDFQNHQELLSGKTSMSSLHYGNPIDSMGDQGAQILEYNLTDLVGDQGAQTPGYNFETMQIGHKSVSQIATITIAQPR